MKPMGDMLYCTYTSPGGCTINVLFEGYEVYDLVMLDS